MKKQIIKESKVQSEKSLYIRTKKNKKTGLWIIFTPIISLLGIFLLYSIVTFIFSIIGEVNDVSSITESSLSDTYQLILSIFQFLFNLLAGISFVAILFCIPLGIIYLFKKELAPEVKHDPRSGKNSGSVIPPEIDCWNWGAFGLTIIWGLYHNIWSALIALLPIGNIVMMIVLGLQGNKFAWKAQRWNSVQGFLVKQNKWKPWGIGFFVLTTIFWLWAIVSLF